eukprot:scaffold1874_cov109-Isochrysis_galbana.AAC.5
MSWIARTRACPGRCSTLDALARAVFTHTHTHSQQGFLGLACEGASQTISRASDGTYRLDNSIDFDGGYLRVRRAAAAASVVGAGSRRLVLTERGRGLHGRFRFGRRNRVGFRRRPGHCGSIVRLRAWARIPPFSLPPPLPPQPSPSPVPIIPRRKLPGRWAPRASRARLGTRSTSASNRARPNGRTSRCHSRPSALAGSRSCTSMTRSGAAATRAETCKSARAASDRGACAKWGASTSRLEPLHAVEPSGIRARRRRWTLDSPAVPLVAAPLSSPVVGMDGCVWRLHRVALTPGARLARVDPSA